MRIKQLNRFRTRRSERVPLKAAVSFRNRDGEISYGWSRDVSLAGIYVFTDDRERLGTLCQIKLTIRRPEGVTRLEVLGQAARHDADGIAFQFADLPADAEAMVHRIIEEHLQASLDADPDALDPHGAPDAAPATAPRAAEAAAPSDPRPARS